MQEKDIVNDALSATKASLDTYSRSIYECGNETLRQTLQQLRNEAEDFHYQLFQIANSKGYYTPAAEASPQDVQNALNGLVGGMQQGQNDTNFTLR